MSTITDLLVRNNRVTAPVIAVIAGVLIVYLSIYVPFLLFAVPVVTFFIFFWLKIYKIKIRFLASLVVFLAVAIIAAGIFAGLVNSNNGRTGYIDLTNGSVIQTSITPYHGPSNDFNYSFVVSGNKSISPYWLNVSSSTSTSFAIHIPQSGFTEKTLPNGSLLLYVHLSNVTDQGVYYYRLFIGNSTTYVANIGPIMVSFTSLWAIEMISYVPGYMILFELMFLVGIFLARSISNSMRYSRRRPPAPPNEPPPQ